MCVFQDGQVVLHLVLHGSSNERSHTRPQKCQFAGMQPTLSVPVRELKSVVVTLAMFLSLEAESLRTQEHIHAINIPQGRCKHARALLSNNCAW